MRLFVFCLLTVGLSWAQSTTSATLHFDLSKIGMVEDGEQECNDTNPRLQEIPSKEMDRIVGAGSKSIPVLIRMLADRRVAQTREPIICYWPGMAIGDIAFCLLTDLFKDTRGKTTVPGADWDSMIDPQDKDNPAWEQLHSTLRRHGVAALQAKWRKMWVQYGDQMHWDGKEECFKLKGQ